MSIEYENTKHKKYSRVKQKHQEENNRQNFGNVWNYQ